MPNSAGRYAAGCRCMRDEDELDRAEDREHHSRTFSSLPDLRDALTLSAMTAAITQHDARSGCIEKHPAGVSYGNDRVEAQPPSPVGPAKRAPSGSHTRLRRFCVFFHGAIHIVRRRPPERGISVNPWM